MRKSMTTRRTGRDRRNAGVWRKARAAERGRSLARSQERELKERALVWNDAARTDRLPAPCPVPASTDGAGSRASGPLADRGPATGCRRMPSRGRIARRHALSASDALPLQAACSWLPPAGATAVVEGVRIIAVDVPDAPRHPFYVLTRA